MRYLIFFCGFTWFASWNVASASTIDSLKWTVQFGTNLSYNGTDLNLALGLTQKRHTIYLGSQINLSDSYFPKRNIGGLLLGYRYEISARKRWASFVQAESQFSFLNTASIPLDNALEIYAGYGLKYRLNRRFSIRNTIGIGGYLEKYATTGGEKDSFSAYAVLIGLNLNFKL